MVPAFSFRPPPDRGGPPPVTVLDTTCEGVWILQGLCNVELLPPTLVLRPFVSADGPPLNHPGMAVMREAGAVQADNTVHPRIALWLDVLGAPDIQLCVTVRRGHDYLRLVVARRDDLHVAISRCDDDVAVEELIGVGSIKDLAARILPLCGTGTEPARFEAITVPSADLIDGIGEVVRGEHTPVVALSHLGLTGEQRRILMLAADEPLCELAMVIIQHHDGGDHITKAAVTVTDTVAGRVVTAPLRGSDGTWLTQISPGTEDAVARGLRSLVATMPVPAWREYSRTH